jgi:ABC-type nitrate/sulfonate/bicarbonate transport system permease component
MADRGVAIPASAQGHRLSSVFSGLVFVAIALGLWKLVVVAFAVPAFMLPPPETAFTAFLDNAGAIGEAVFFTLRNAAVGLLVAFVIAMSLAAIFVSSRLTTRAVLPIVIGFRTAPVLAIAPILIMVFGRGIGTAIVVVVIVSFFPIMVNAMRGFTATPKSAMELMHVLGAGWFVTFAKVRLPFSIPYIFTGLRSAATSAMLSAMLAEWLSGAPGLGTLILDASSYRKSGLLWAGVVVSMAVAFAIFTLTTLLERRLTAWRTP